MTGAAGEHKRFSRKEKQQLTRTAIIDAAITEFAERGVEGSSLESIARHAGLTQGAIYSNFASKSELWWTVVEQLTHTLDVAGPFESDRPLRQQLEALGAAVWRFLRSTSRTELLLAQEFDLFLMRRPARAGQVRAGRPRRGRRPRRDARAQRRRPRRASADRGDIARPHHRRRRPRPAALVHARSPARRRAVVRHRLRCPRPLPAGRGLTTCRRVRRTARGTEQ